MKSAITVTRLGKAYKHYHSRWSRLAEWMVPGHQPRHTLKWVLQDVNFTVEAGGAVGIVGVNGAGKSTLLKLIAGITQPTTGTVATVGRVAALLELGMGFHPYFTGRQNVYMSGQLMGIPSEEIDGLMPQIEDFADIGDYVDLPVRVYSSGMQMRLAFAVATAVRPDILIVDEALSVGDAFFQHKCMRRIRDFRENGTTLLFVSHSPDIVRMLCDQGVLLADGKIEKMGDAATVMDYYRASQVVQTEGGVARPSALVESEGLWDERNTKVLVANKTVGSVSADILSDRKPLHSGDFVSIRIKVEFQSNYQAPHIGFGIRNKMGVIIYEANTFTLNHKTRSVSTGDKMSVTFSFPCHLAPDTYELEIGVADGGYHSGSFEQVLFFDQSFLIFEVASPGNTGWIGIYNLQPDIIID